MDAEAAASLVLALAAATPCFIELTASLALLPTFAFTFFAAELALAIVGKFGLAAAALGVWGAGALQVWSEGKRWLGQNCPLHWSHRMGEKRIFLQLLRPQMGVFLA